MKRIILYSVLIFIFSVGIGFYYSSLWKKENLKKIEAQSYENKIQETSYTEEKLSYNAKLLLKKYYNECGHVKENDVELPNEFINMTEEEIEKLYSEWRVESFSSDSVTLSQNVDSMCDDHYALKLGESNIEIYKIQEYDDYKLLKETNISKEYLTADDIKELESGIFVYGVEMLNSALEDFE